MDNMNITAAQYQVDSMSGANCSIQATVEGVTVLVPFDKANRHYVEIMRQVAAGTLVVLAANE